MKQQLCLFIAFARTIFAAGNEPCETNNFIDDWKRSAAYITENPVCDSFLYEDWYRVTSGAGEKMPTRCLVGGWRCGTIYPIWLSGDNVPSDQNLYPAVNETVDRVAYAVVDDNCIARSYNIRIKNCTHYYVYYLRPSTGCPSAYCFGTELPCPPGKYSETGFSPDCGTFPTVTVSPKISVSMHKEIKTNANGTAKIFYSPKFACTADDATDEYTYDIRYYINDVAIDSATHLRVSLGNISKSVLLQEHWDRVFKPNMMVKCSIQVRADGFESPGHKNFSEQYFAGIRVPGGEHGFTVKEGEGLKIPLEVTLPIGCSHTVDDPRADKIKETACFVQLLTAIPKYQVDKCINGLTTNGLQFVSQKCNKTISHANWNYNAHFIEVRGESDLKINLKDRITFLRLWTDPHHSSLSDQLDFWQDVHLPDIKILIIDTDKLSLGHSCYSHNDPHMRLFDGRHWELQNTFRDPTEGEYVMYKHDRLPQQINAFFRKCNIFGMALCNCGVAVRSGESIFVANFCETVKLGQRRVNRYVASWLCDDQHLVVQETGNNYKVSLPSGTTVEFSHGSVYDFYGIHSIDIRPSQLDYDLTSGLCGRYNKISTDDFVDRVTNLELKDHWEFAKSWKVDAASGESLFDPTQKLPEIMYYLQEYCTCQKDEQLNQFINKCFSSQAMEKCRNIKSTTSVYHASCRSSNFRTKRDLSIQDDEDNKPPMFSMELELHADQQGSEEPLNWRNGLTVDIARAKCQEAFVKSTALSPCTEYVPTVNSEDYVKECIEDMKILGDDSFLKVTLETFASSCLAAASRMENLTNTNSSEEISDEGTNSLQKSIFQIIEESTCPENCSGKGICESGVCKCNENFFGVDCSKEKSRAPILEKAAFEGICDISKRPCRKYVIPGLDFYPTNLTCKFRAYEVIKNESSSELKESTESFTHPGVYSSLFLVYCEIPESRRKRSLLASDVIATGFYISLSNDGLNFTEELTVMAFDSRCYDCNMSTLSCKIEFEDDCPYKVVMVPSDSHGSKYIGIGVGISIGLALVAGLAIVMALCIRKKMIRKNRYDVKEQSKPEKELQGTTYFIYDAK